MGHGALGTVRMGYGALGQARSSANTYHARPFKNLETSLGMMGVLVWFGEELEISPAESKILEKSLLGSNWWSSSKLMTQSEPGVWNLQPQCGVRYSL